MAFRARKIFGTFEKRATGSRFSKVPKLYGPFSGVTIPFVSQERRRFKSSNYTVLFFFFKHVKRSAFQNKRLAVSQMASGSEKFSGLSRNGPRAPGVQTMDSAIRRINYYSVDRIVIYPVDSVIHLLNN